jgi:tetratricopeptide (TPR) repeat protein
LTVDMRHGEARRARTDPRFREEQFPMTPAPSTLRALGVLPIALLVACGTVPVRVPVVRPAEINMAPYQTVAIGDMRGHGERVFGATLEEALVASNRFQVLDRQHLSSVMRELQLSASDLADPRNAAKLGRVMSAGALIYGDVDEGYRELPSDERITNNDGSVVHVHKLRGELTMRATFKIVDVATGRLLIAKTYEERRADTNVGYDRRPEPIDVAPLERAARNAVVDRFMRAILPHQEYVTASFRKDSDLPQLEGGIGWAERGEWKKAQDSFNAAIADSEKNPKIKSDQLGKAYWNLGLAYEYSGDYDKATAIVQKAYDLSNDRSMLAELDNIRRLQLDSQKVAEQTQAPEAAGAR